MDFIKDLEQCKLNKNILLGKFEDLKDNSENFEDYLFYESFYELVNILDEASFGFKFKKVDKDIEWEKLNNMNIFKFRKPMFDREHLYIPVKLFKICEEFKNNHSTTNEYDKDDIEKLISTFSTNSDKITIDKKYVKPEEKPLFDKFFGNSYNNKKLYRWAVVCTKSLFKTIEFKYKENEDISILIDNWLNILDEFFQKYTIINDKNMQYKNICYHYNLTYSETTGTFTKREENLIDDPYLEIINLKELISNELDRELKKNSSITDKIPKSLDDNMFIEKSI